MGVAVNEEFGSAFGKEKNKVLLSCWFETTSILPSPFTSAAARRAVRPLAPEPEVPSPRKVPSPRPSEKINMLRNGEVGRNQTGIALASTRMSGLPSPS